LSLRIRSMHLQPTRLLGLSLALWLGFAAHCAAQGVTNDEDVIEFGIPRSTLIVSGQFLGTFSGGGGADSSVKPVRVFKAAKAFQLPKEVVVHWTTDKKYDHQLVQSNSVVFLFFLRPEEGRSPGQYRDVTGAGYPFIRASSENVRLLLSKLKEKK
jgi:hypothetical protein